MFLVSVHGWGCCALETSHSDASGPFCLVSSKITRPCSNPTNLALNMPSSFRNPSLFFSVRTSDLLVGKAGRSAVKWQSCFKQGCRRYQCRCLWQLSSAPAPLSQAGLSLWPCSRSGLHLSFCLLSPMPSAYLVALKPVLLLQ